MRFSEWIPEMTPFSPGYFEKNAVLPGNTRFREFDHMFAAKRCCFDLNFFSFHESFECFHV